MGSINDQAFSHVLREDLSQAHALASDLLREFDREMSRDPSASNDYFAPE
jgi:hypothetical protein